MTDINEIGATAFAIASIRALEDGRPEPLFSDPYARWFSNERAREVVLQLRTAYPPSWTMVRLRTRYFDRFVERGIAAGARQVVLLGGGFDMRAHRYGGTGAAFFEVDQKAVLEFKREVLERGGLAQPPSLPGDYLDTDVPAGLAELGFDPAAPTLIVWEGNTMYLTPDSVMPFLNRLAGALSSFRIAFDYFGVDLQRRDLETAAGFEWIERLERAMGASFPTGFADPWVFERETPLMVLEDGSFTSLAGEFGQGEVVAAYQEDWREMLGLYRYCVLSGRSRPEPAESG